MGANDVTHTELACGDVDHPELRLGRAGNKVGFKRRSRRALRGTWEQRCSSNLKPMGCALVRFPGSSTPTLDGDRDGDDGCQRRRGEPAPHQGGPPFRSIPHGVWIASTKIDQKRVGQRRKWIWVRDWWAASLVSTRHLPHQRAASVLALPAAVCTAAEVERLMEYSNPPERGPALGAHTQVNTPPGAVRRAGRGQGHRRADGGLVRPEALGVRGEALRVELSSPARASGLARRSRRWPKAAPPLL